MRVIFGEFTLDSATRQLHQGGRERHLSPKAFDLLALLIRHRPGVVDKEALRDALWPGTNVVDANLNNLAAEVRSVLGDDAQKPRFLRTVHRVGYAFCAEAVDADEAGPSVTRSGGATSGPRAWLVWQDRPIVLADGERTLGRDPTCDVWIDVPGVSRRHAAIRVAASAATPSASIEDLASTNGTFVDGRAVQGRVTLADGQSIRMGEAAMTFRLWGASGVATKRIRKR
jgi:DNA-binding winged helix-turn-helix (wHTH) protein